MTPKVKLFYLIALISLLLASPAAGLAVNEAQGGQQARPVVRYASRTDTTAPLYELPPMPPVLGEIFEAKPPKRLPNRLDSSGPAGSDLVQESSGPAAPTVGANFEGVNNVNGVLPPDTVGDIGPNHYVQMVNLAFGIWDRSGNLLYGPVNNNTLWQGFGGPCQNTNNGDPIVLYDHLADRWMMSQFALPNFPRGPFYQCIAVSQTGDPLGAWHRYEFTISQDKLNDYPKFGVWPDGYYMAVNQFKCRVVSCSWAGQGVVAFEREAMLAGAAARMVYFDLYSLDPNLGGMLPSDLDGPAPPSGAPNPFVQVDDNAWGYSPDQLQIWEFRVNWANASSSTFTHAGNLGTAAFDANMCGYSRNCIPQPGGTKVDAISDRLMYRLQYRNFGSHQTLVVNHTVDVNGSDRAGVRWYELRKSGGGWSMYQQGTYSPDSNHRWMASIAMNGAGDMALGYSVSSTTVYPSIRATGRLDGDSLGQMTQGELTIINGSGYQTHSSGRWGDYSMMAVDPVDDCTFWYTQEYYAVVGTAPWQTRIGSFKLRECGPVDNPPSVRVISPGEGSMVAGTVAVQIEATDGEDAAGTLTVEWNVDGESWQAASYNSGSGYYEASLDTTSLADGSHTFNARASDSSGNTASASNNFTVDNVNDAPTANFTFSCSGLACDFDGSSSFDPDGTINSYAWDFGDGFSDSGVTTSHTYGEAGTYSVKLTVTDDDGASGEQTQQVSVSEVASMHLGGLTGSSNAIGSRNWRATVTITVHDAGHNPVSGATVSGSWSGGTSGNASCTTGSNGTCSVTSGNINNSQSSATFTVTNLTNSSYTYDPSANDVSSSITIPKP